MTDIHHVIDRSRLYVLIGGLETDLRAIVTRWVLEVKDEQTAFGGRFEVLQARAEKDRNTAAALIEYADFADCFGLINRSRDLVPDGIASPVKAFTPRLASFVGPRNRVMHSRPLESGDLEAGVELCIDIANTSIPCPTVQDLLQRIQSDPEWSPAIRSSITPESRVHHNLPVPEFDETGLLGRVADQKALLQRLTKGRDSVITLVGEGGMGKTALAVSALYELVELDDCPYDAVLWASLKTERLTAEGVETVLNAAEDVLGAAHAIGLGLDETFDGTIAELGSVLSGLEILVVIDNVESADSSEIINFYDAMPDTTRLLLTSRVGLGQLERRLPVGPLDTQSAIRMLRVLARRRGLNQLFKLSDSQLSSQVKRLRATPLAIRWYVEAVHAGLEPRVAIDDQSELLRFCLETIYHDVSEEARLCMSVLYAAQSVLDAPQIAIAASVPVDDLNRALQDLQRRSLVEVQLAGEDGLHQRYKLTPAAAHYLSSVDRPSGGVLKDVENRLQELRRSEEERQRLAETDVTRPAYIEVIEEQQKPVAHLLRRAVISLKRNPGRSQADLQQAEALATDYYEVYRVKGFIAAQQGYPEAAADAYELAYDMAPTPRTRAQVAFFYSRVLGTRLGEVQRASQLAKEALDVLQTSSAALRYGQCLVYAGDHAGAREILEEVVRTGKDTKTVLIARTQLVNLTKRKVEELRRDRKAIVAVQHGARALRETSVYLDTGVTDAVLRENAIDLATESLQAGLDVPDLYKVEESLGDVVQFGRARVTELLFDSNRGYWIRAGKRILDHHSVPKSLEVALEDLLPRIDQTADDADRVRATVYSYDDDKGFGFVDLPRRAERGFLHRSSVPDKSSLALLVHGATVVCSITEGDKGPRALQVTIEVSPEVESELLAKRHAVVTHKGSDNLLARDTRTKVVVSVDAPAMRSNEWKKVSRNDRLEMDLELTRRNPRAVSGTVQLLRN